MPETPDGQLARVRAAVFSRLDERLDEHVVEVTRTVRREVPAYGVPKGLTAETLRWAGRRYLRITLEAMGDAGRLGEAARELIREIGRERARQGVPLHAMVQGYQVGARVLWQALLTELEQTEMTRDVHARLLAELSSASLQLTSEVAATVTEAYAEIKQDRTLDLERARSDVWHELLAGTGAGTGLLRRRAESVGYRLGETHQVALVRAEDSAPSAQTRGAHMRIADALQGCLPAHLPPIVHRDGPAVVAIYPLASAPPEVDVAGAIATALERASLGDLSYVSAVGRPEPGVKGIADSYRQASRTADYARDCGLTCQTIRYTASLPWLLLQASPELAADLVHDTVTPLATYDAARGTALVETAETLIAVVGSRAEAAKRLHVHRHTLAARLTRIEELSGCSLDDSDDVLRLTLGLRAHRLLTED